MALVLPSLILKLQKGLHVPLTRSRHVGWPRLKNSGLDLIGFREPEILQSFEQRQEERNPRDSEAERLINIGYTNPRTRREYRLFEKEREKLLKKARSDTALERAARHRSLQIPLEEVEREWNAMQSSEQVCGAALHYGIFRDLYGAAYFLPQVPLDIRFPSEEGFNTPVYRGNMISPADALAAPEVTFSAPQDTLWTLLLTNLDGHLTQPECEYVHYLVGNIPGGDISQGQKLVDYLQPIPLRGTGFHRYAFVLYKQESEIEYSRMVLPSERSTDLQSRTFRTKDFYRHHQEVLTPAGLAFFTSEWDESVTKCFHKTLDMLEPAFEYEHQAQYIARPVRYPVNQPFNMYLDRYRDKREMAEEMVKKRLKVTSPFKADPPRSKWPLIDPMGKDVLSWQRTEIKKERLGFGKYSLLYNPMAKWPQR
ncbi:hypothetical protein RvY_08319 [Ramazzottius varieornatus]|uniref:Large ribosomal subunit protein mL38 n=1 Tax=Ramazzottius varieornatus TaxID=947166 RepID=A0A1D1V849_RAMVA|nr:hypothetical protein RvY_08319 [Ramazzottius varieornatus]